MDQPMDMKTKAMMWVMIGQIVRLVLTLIFLWLAWLLWPNPGRIIATFGMALLLGVGVLLHIAKMRIAR